MKNRFLLIRKFITFSICLILWTGNTLYAQLGLGTNLPDINADLTLGSEDKGLLLNNVKLVSLNSASPLILKDMTPGMLVYNTTNNVDISEGVYCWTKENKWSRMYVKTKATRDMQFVVFKQTNSEITLNINKPVQSISDLDYEYKAEKNGLLFLDYVVYAQLSSGKKKAGNTFCHTLVTDNLGDVVFKGITAISPYVVVDLQGKNSSFGLSSFVFNVEKGKTYTIRLTAQETYASSGYTVTVGNFVYKQTARSSMKVTFMTEAEY